MEISEQALKEFELLWQQDHPGQTIPREKILKVANKVLHAVELLYINENE